MRKQKKKEVTLPQDRLAAPRFGSRQVGCPQHPELSVFAAELQVRHGAVHHLVLFGTATCFESNCSSAVPALPGVPWIGCGDDQPEACGSLAYEAADSGLLSPELAAGIRRVKGVKQLGSRAGNCGLETG
jgi:hypothetical protein